MLKSLYRLLSPKFQTVFLDYKVNFKPRFDPSAGRSLPILIDIINQNRLEYSSQLTGFLNYQDELLTIPDAAAQKDDNLPSWNNGFLPGLDIVALYSMVRNLKPATYVEIGSGNSTKVARKAINDGKLNTKLVSIDPFPRANIDHLSDMVIRQPVEDMKNHELFASLKKNDILFIDNSHRCLPNSDVTVCFLEILPLLKPGVIVHVHDIYLPYDYPQFMCDRAYSEQYVLAAMIMANPEKYSTLLPNFFVSEDKELKLILKDFWERDQLNGVEQHGGSYWMTIN